MPRRFNKGDTVKISTGSLEKTQRYCGVNSEMERQKGNFGTIMGYSSDGVYEVKTGKYTFNWHQQDLLEVKEDITPIKIESVTFDPSLLVS